MTSAVYFQMVQKNIYIQIEISECGKVLTIYESGWRLHRSSHTILTAPVSEMIFKWQAKREKELI